MITTLVCAPLVVCGPGWFAACGASAVRARAEAGEPLIQLDPVAEDALSSCSSAGSSLRHRLNQLLLHSGIRWGLMRQTRPAGRGDLAVQVAARTAPAGPRRAVDAGELHRARLPRRAGHVAVWS